MTPDELEAWIERTWLEATPDDIARLMQSVMKPRRVWRGKRKKP